MFEAVHGSAPDIAGLGIANPSGLLLAATQMLVHVGQAQPAELIKNAWLATLESGLHTADIYRADISRARVGTRDFADAVIARLGERPTTLRPVQYKPGGITVHARTPAPRNKALAGIDVFLDWTEGQRDPERLGHVIESAVPEDWHLKMITNRGVKVYPEGIPETYRTDHWRCRFLPTTSAVPTFNRVLGLLGALHQRGLDIIKTEHLYNMDGTPAYSLGQGE